MKVEFLSVAQKEFDLAVNFYNEESAGLGYRFAIEVKDALDRIRKYPEAWHPLSENTRRCRVAHFPYAVIYTITKEMILVLAIMHLKRHPDSWKN